MIRPYLDGKLSERDLAAFLNHIRDCSKCYNDLETEFMVDQTVKYLNGRETGSFNLAPLLHEDIRRSTERLLKKRKMRRLRLVIMIITLAAAALLVLDLTGLFRITLFIRSLAGAAFL